MRKRYSTRLGNKYQGIRRSTMKKRYFKRGNVNEYFHKKNNVSTWQSKVVLYFLIFIFIYLVYFFFFSSYFKIDRVIIEGNEEITKLEIEEKFNNLINQRKFLLLKNNNYFLFKTDDLESKLLEDYLLDSLVVEKKYFSTVFITLKEKPHKLFYIINDSSFLIDENGLAISRLDSELDVLTEEREESRSNEKIIVKELPQELVINQDEIDEQVDKMVKDHEVYDNTNSTSTVFVWENTSEGMIVKEVDLIEAQIEEVYPDFPEIGSEVFSSDIVRKILYLDSNYNHKFGEGRKYYEFEYDKDGFIVMLTEAGYRIFFKLNEAIDSQLSNLYRYFIEEGNSLEGVEYVDLRQKDQIIIK